MQTFSLRPADPDTSIRLRLVLDGDELPHRAYTVLVAARDHDGDCIEPTSPAWSFSRALRGFYAYSSAARNGVSELPLWTADAIPDELTISVTPWPGNQEPVTSRPIAVALSSGGLENGSCTTWELVTQEGSEA